MQLRSGAEQRVRKTSGRIDQMLAVVEDKEELTRPHVVGQCFGDGMTGPVGQAHGEGDGMRQQVSVSE